MQGVNIQPSLRGQNSAVVDNFLNGHPLRALWKMKNWRGDWKS
jgi:hypothetical protein